MGRKPQGGVYFSRGQAYARVTIARGNRPSFPLADCQTEAEALERLPRLVDIAERLREAGQPAELVEKLVRAAADTTDADRLQKVENTVAKLEAGKLAAPKNKGAPLGETVQDIGQAWTDGTLAERYPDHVKRKRSAYDDAGRLTRHVYPIIGDVPIRLFTLDHAEAVMRTLPDNLSQRSRRHVAQVLHRLLAMCVYPLRLVEYSPLPRGWMPKLGKGRVSDVLYPDEDARLMAAKAVALPLRVLFGFMAREGLRPGEAAALQWRDLDLKRGRVQLDENKTDDPRAWNLEPGTTAALERWRELSPVRTGLDDRVFCSESGGTVMRHRRGSKTPELVIKAEAYREALTAAGIDRPQLFTDTKVRQPTRIHDLRGLFVTWALASGRTEAEVIDKTGHKSSGQIATYRRRARQLADLGYGELEPLVDAIPELRSKTGRSGSNKGGKRAPPTKARSKALRGMAKTPRKRRVSAGRSRPLGFKIRCPSGRTSSILVGATKLQNKGSEHFDDPTETPYAAPLFSSAGALISGQAVNENLRAAVLVAGDGIPPAAIARVLGRHWPASTTAGEYLDALLEAAEELLDEARGVKKRADDAGAEVIDLQARRKRGAK